MNEHVALDLFAGHGWGVALKKLGAEEHAVEIMKEAVATRELNGMATAYGDVWDAHLAAEIEHDTEIASPPCQAYSPAGKGAGRKALDDVLRAIDERRFEDIDDLREFALSLGDERIGLVLTPLHYAVRYRPKFIIWEQVPPVLPIWKACAEVLRWRGYSVVTEILNAEQYGVPQTRRRAILIATLEGEAKMPTPTHSRYYSRTPGKLDPGVQKWVSMAEALGWAPDSLVGFARKADDKGAATADGYRARDLREAKNPAQNVTEKTRSWTRRIAAKAMGSGMVERYGERRGREMDEPAFTIRGSAGGMEPGGFRWKEIACEGTEWTHNRPAPTIAADPRVAPPGCKHPAAGCCSLNRDGHLKGRQFPEGTIRVTIEEAAALQSYPADFVFAGSKTKQFLQVGNAVPPLLAQACIEAAWASAEAIQIEEEAA